ncbi:MAG TPA: phosphate ABC transporter ATP-binding protein [Ktedonobacter sp.]|jgi:phosphate transport system ATP-binding protein|nr:phosphate ABC transporter ATP-binding protein [Ktedonobacter sp.]HAT45657.1 phosphate ABC transporter ATP-binding protein [Ktedonobacter sp.]HBE24782.1 phosphate ABC transporter ATP-binding protein [Ktedonobacter sp.]HCF85266.1 phosphate ABC transporter ATP-binding protein [Ktedonobacter sp.]HCJ33914.1 phosphate ABC transporter ATP-binding protein [Ktedonobacter sp.]
MSISVENVNAWYGKKQALYDVNLAFEPLSVTAMIGPSGCGKSTFIRCLNRMHEEVPDARVTGKVLVDGVDIYARSIKPMYVRQHIGMVFQQPNPLPTRSIFENVALGPRINGQANGSSLKELVEHSLRQAALWDEVKDQLDAPATQLSGGQQQRLCIARAVANQPQILLMDEPCSALDPISTLEIEELIRQLKQAYTIILVTHNMQQAGRVADRTVFFLLGRIIEVGNTSEFFSHPQKKESEDYISGRFG